MGCCASKEQEDAVITKGGEAAAFTGAVAGGAAIGAAISGPAAPIGAAVGGVVGAIVGKATAGTVGKVVSVPVGMLNDVWRGLLNRQEVLELLPDIGMLKTERAVYPPAMSDLSSTNSYLYQTHGTAIAGLPYMQALRGEPLTDAQRKSLSLAVRRLEAKKVVAITGDCGAMLHYQHQVAALSTRPVLLSALLQAPLLATTFKSDEQVLVITSDKTVTTDAVLKSLLLKTGLPTHALERFPLLGCEHIEGFRSSALAGGEGARIDPEATMAALLLMVRSAVASQPSIRAVLLESTMLPAFADVLRKELSIPVFDSTTLVDMVHKGMTDNPRFGVSFGPSNAPTARLKPEELPGIGIMRIDYTYPPAMGDAAHPNSYYYRTPHAVVKGLTFEAAQRGEPLTDAQRGAMAAAIGQLEAQPDMLGIAGDCGFLINYQADAVRLSTKVPCFISAVLQCPLLAAIFAKDEQVLVLTANGPALAAVFPRLLRLCHVGQEDIARFVVDGCEALPGFEAVANAQKVDVAKVQPHVVALVKKHLKANPKIRAVLLECTELPPYADAIRHDTGLLVLDVITLIDYFHAAVSPNPYYGIDWQKLAATPVKD